MTRDAYEHALLQILAGKSASAAESRLHNARVSFIQIIRDFFYAWRPSIETLHVAESLRT